MSKKHILTLFLLVICAVNTIAQTCYYYEGTKIPLTTDYTKVCMSIRKDKEIVTKEILRDFNVLDSIKNADIDTYIIQQSNHNDISVLNARRKKIKSIILSPCFKTKENEEIFLTPYLNVRLKDEKDFNLLTSCAEKYGLRIVGQAPLMPLWYILSVSSNTGKNALDVANELWESGKFSAVEPDLCAKDLLCSDDPKFDLQWGLYNRDNYGIDINASPAWNFATGKDVKIAILDTGVDLNHIDLRSNICNLSYDTENDSSQSIVYENHGTHCAGIAAAVKDNGIQIAGVAPEATIVSISNTLRRTAYNAQMKLASGITWAYQHGADIISNSWHHPTPHAAIDEAIRNAFRYGRQEKGCVVAFAAGNKTTLNNNFNIRYPANSNDTILVVGSINNAGEKAPTSCYGEKLDIVAPGVNILSTLPNNQTGYKSGTSMACPHVAGVAALILQRNPELTVAQVNSIICRNAKKLSNVIFNETKPDGSWNNEYGYGLVDAYSSILDTPEIVYIQNDTITGTQTIPTSSANSAQKIYVGRNVTERKEHGNVILGQGNITLRTKSLLIKNSTIIPLGTKLKVGTQ